MPTHTVNLHELTLDAHDRTHTEMVKKSRYVEGGATTALYQALPVNHLGLRCLGAYTFSIL